MGAIGIVVIVVVVLVVGVAGWLLAGKAATQKLATLREEVDRPDLERAETASSFGVTSKGAAQSRGLGVLALSTGHLEFRPTAGKGFVLVDREAITGADVVRSHLGKAHTSDLLHVTWTDPAVAGGSDDAAWRVPEVGWWVERLG